MSAIFRIACVAVFGIFAVASAQYWGHPYASRLYYARLGDSPSYNLPELQEKQYPSLVVARFQPQGNYAPPTAPSIKPPNFKPDFEPDVKPSTTPAQNAPPAKSARAVLY